MQCYVDASFLARAVTRGDQAEGARALLRERSGDLVTTAVARAELWTLLADAGHEARIEAQQFLDEMTEIRFSDRGLEQASLVLPALAPFVALQLGAILTTEAVRDLATYDRELAQAGRLFGLHVLSPGLPELWYA